MNESKEDKNEKKENIIKDESLALQAQQGDKTAAEILLERYKNSVRVLARSYFLEGGETEDLIQEGMIGLYLAITDFREGGMSFKNFAYLCISRKMVGAVRSASRKKHLPLNDGVPFPDGKEAGWLSSENPEDALIGLEDRQEFLSAVRGSLTDKEYTALLQYMEGESISEIAASCKISVKSADNAVQRAKKKVMKLLDKRS